MTPLSKMITQTQLRWIGHVIRMPSIRLPRRVLYGQLTHGDRQRGGQKKRFSDHLNAIVKKCHIHIPSDHEVLASDRSTWQGTCKSGLIAFMTENNRAAEDRRARQHGFSSSAPNGLCCPKSNKCAPPTSVSEVILEVTNRHNNSTASSSNRRTTSRQNKAIFSSFSIKQTQIR